MELAAIVLSSDTLVRVFVFIVYILAGLVSYRRLIPRLLPSAKWLAVGMLAAQILVILVSLTIQPNSRDYEWLWHLNGERNLPAMLAATQLTLAGSMAMLTAWLAKTRPIWDRLYFVGIGWLFLHLARDEFYVFHESYPETWQLTYAALGATAVLATLVVAMRSPRKTRMWHMLLLSGLAISALGALIVEEFPIACVDLFIPKSGCVLSYQYEEVLEFLGIWLALCAVLGHYSALVPRPRRVIDRLLYFLPILSITALLLPFWFTFFSSLEIHFTAHAASIKYESDLRLHAYRTEWSERRFAAKIFLSSKSWHNFTDLGYSVHLVDQISGKSVAGADESENRHQQWRIALNDFNTNYSRWIQVDIPEDAPTNRALWVVLTLWRDEGDQFVRLKVLESDHRLLDDTQVVLWELVLPSTSAALPSSLLAEYDKRITLEAVDMPLRAQPGENLSIEFAWHASKNPTTTTSYNSCISATRSSGNWWVYDQQPLGARLPTRLWYSGLADSETWQVPLPADLAPGRYAVYTGLYRQADLERLPADGRGRKAFY